MHFQGKGKWANWTYRVTGFEFSEIAAFALFSLQKYLEKMKLEDIAVVSWPVSYFVDVWVGNTASQNLGELVNVNLLPWAFQSH